MSVSDGVIFRDCCYCCLIVSVVSVCATVLNQMFNVDVSGSVVDVVIVCFTARAANRGCDWWFV